MNQKQTTPVSRREKITKTGSTVFIVVAAAAVIVMFSLISIRFLWQRKSYNDRVVTAKTTARDTIQSNLTNLEKLSSQFSALDSSTTTNSKTILHALPPVYDYASVATSMEELAQQSGVTFSGSIGQDQSASAVLKANISSPIEIPLSLEVSGNYDSVVKYIQNLEYSIRPINVTGLNISGKSGGLKATITAVTYYQPAQSLDVSKSEVK